MIRYLTTTDGEDAIRVSFPNGWTVEIVIGHDWLGHCRAFRGGTLATEHDGMRDAFHGPQDAQAEEVLGFLNEVVAKEN